MQQGGKLPETLRGRGGGQEVRRKKKEVKKKEKKDCTAMSISVIPSLTTSERYLDNVHFILLHIRGERIEGEKMKHSEIIL